MIQVGQGVLGIIPFKDGHIPAYNRTYLVVSVSDTKVGLLNISSVAGKERKLLFPANKLLKKHKPPFCKISFVKLDSLVYVSICEASRLKVLHNGECLEREEMEDILSKLTL